jgi:hypothetical protein
MAKIQRGTCRFIVSSTDGNPSIQIEVFHDSVQALSGGRLSLGLLTGTSQKDASRLADSMNEWIRELAFVERES